MPSITSANAVIMMQQPILFPAPVQLQQFAPDDIYDFDVTQIVEESMGVDGTLSFGFIFVPRVMNITLQANSPANTFFDTIQQAQRAALDVYPLTGTIAIPAVSTKWIMNNGALRNFAPAPAAKRVLQPRRFTVVWEYVAAAPM